MNYGSAASGKAFGQRSEACSREDLVRSRIDHIHKIPPSNFIGCHFEHSCCSVEHDVDPERLGSDSMLQQTHAYMQVSPAQAPSHPTPPPPHPHHSPFLPSLSTPTNSSLLYHLTARLKPSSNPTAG